MDRHAQYETMLEIETYRPFGANVEIAIDEYVPLIVTTSPGSLAVCYHTVGDRVTSLVEVKIERVSRLVRELVLVSSFDADLLKRFLGHAVESQ